MKIPAHPIEPCIVETSTQDEWNDAVKICLDKGMLWETEDTPFEISRQYFSSPKTYLIIYKRLTYSGTRTREKGILAKTPYIKFKDFKKKYSPDHGQYRIKTEKEFINEFGSAWRTEVELAFPHEMDAFLGISLSKEQVKEFEMSNTLHLDRWVFSRDMITLESSEELKSVKFRLAELYRRSL